MNKLIPATFFVAFVLVLGPAAYAGPNSATRSNSATDQYVEMIPDLGGDRVPGRDGVPGKGETSTPSPAALKQLAALGPEGALAATVAEATAPIPRRGDSRGGNGEQPGDGSGSDASPQAIAPEALKTETSAIGSVLSGIAGGSAGLLFSLLLVIPLLGAIAIRLTETKRNGS